MNANILIGNSSPESSTEITACEMLVYLTEETRLSLFRALFSYLPLRQKLKLGTNRQISKGHRAGGDSNPDSHSLTLGGYRERAKGLAPVGLEERDQGPSHSLSQEPAMDLGVGPMLEEPLAGLTCWANSGRDKLICVNETEPGGCACRMAWSLKTCWERLLALLLFKVRLWLIGMAFSNCCLETDPFPDLRKNLVSQNNLNEKGR